MAQFGDPTCSSAGWSILRSVSSHCPRWELCQATFRRLPKSGSTRAACRLRTETQSAVGLDGLHFATEEGLTTDALRDTGNSRVHNVADVCDVDPPGYCWLLG
jgi:hypothetical protein